VAVKDLLQKAGRADQPLHCRKSTTRRSST
jgi:hypothetical protein